MADADYRSWVEVLPDFNRFNDTVESAVVGGMAGAGSSGSAAMGGALIAGAKRFAGPLIAAFGLAEIGGFILDQVKAGVDASLNYIRGAVAGAADLEQSVGAVDAVFKDAAGSVLAWGRVSATELGLSKNDYYEFATVVGAQLKNLGIPMEDVAGQTNDLISLGADLAAQYGGSTKDAVAALSSLLRGERDPIERYGVGIKQVDINARLAEKGLGDLTLEQEKQATILATLEILNEQTADAQGAFTRETGTLLNEQQKLQATLDDVSAEFGEHLLPVIADVMVFVRDNLLPIWKDLNETVGPALAGALELIWEPIGRLWDEFTRLFELLSPDGVSILAVIAAGILLVGIGLATGIDLIAAYTQAWADFFAFIRGDLSLEDVVARVGQRLGDLKDNFVRRMEEARESVHEINTLINSLGDEAMKAGYRVGEQFAIGLESSVPTMEQAMRTSMHKVGQYFPHSPAKAGPFAGAGWDQVRRSGMALMEQFTSGMGDVPVRLDVSPSRSLAPLSVPRLRAEPIGDVPLQVYVQNPFTGEYLLQQVDVRAGRVVDEKVARAIPAKFGGK